MNVKMWIRTQISDLLLAFVFDLTYREQILSATFASVFSNIGPKPALAWKFIRIGIAHLTAVLNLTKPE